MCVLDIDDATVTIKGNRVLDDIEINSIIAVVEGDLTLNVCQSKNGSDVQQCVNIIAEDVVDASKTFIGFSLFDACAKKGHKKACRS